MPKYETVTLSMKMILTVLHCLRSYQYGNGSTDLAKEMADALEKEIGQAPHP